MIRHVVMWKVSEDALGEDETKEQAVRRLAGSLNALVEKVPGVVALSAGSNCVDADGNWDMGLVADFENQADLDAYAVHPLHLEVVAQIRAVVSARACVDFEV